jgi:dipeptidyl aminopeptidase/acylaminoacyl peptidase
MSGAVDRVAGVADYRDFEPSARFQETLAVSPDGTTLAYIDDTQGHFNLAVRPVAGGPSRHLTSYTDSTVRHASWHSDGRSLLYMADSAGDERYQLYLIDEAGGQPTALTEPGTAGYWPAFGDPFSPDGRYLAYAGNDRSPSDQDVLIRDLNTGEVRRAYAGGGRIYASHWSPDSTRLTIVDWRGATTDQIIYVLSIDDGGVTQITPSDGSATYDPGPWLPDGSGILVMTDFGRDHTGLASLDPETGRLSWIDAPDWDVEQVAVSPDGRTLAWLVNVEGASHLRAKDLMSGEDIPVPALPAGSASQLLLTPDGRQAVMLMSTPTTPWNIVVADLTSGDLRWVTEERPPVDPSTLVDPVLIHYPAPGGRTVPALLYRPSASEKIPVVLAIHGGPPAQERPNYSNDGLFQYLASRGVAVLAPNIRGSSGYGLAYQRAVHRDWGGVDLQDLDAAARYLKNQPWVDPARIGLFGRSYGGFAVLSCVSRLPEHDWAAAVAWCAPSNLVTFARAQPPTWRAQVAIMIGDPDTDSKLLMSRSPVTYADDIRAALFLIQGANDVRVPRHESDQIVQRLRDRGVEVRYDVYPDEGHVFGNRADQTQARSDAAGFLLAHLADPNVAADPASPEHRFQDVPQDSGAEGW